MEHVLWRLRCPNTPPRSSLFHFFSKVDFEDFKIGSLLNVLKRMIKIKNVVFEGYNGHLGS